MLVAGALLALNAHAEPWVAPGDILLRHDLQRLDDVGAIDLPLTSWPLAWADVERSLTEAETRELRPSEWAAYSRIKDRLRREADERVRYQAYAAAAENPRVIRTFQDTPRESGELSAGMAWFGRRLALNLNASVVHDPFDGDEVRPDGSYLGLTLGNWLLSAGWQDRWWGPGRDGSLILSNNARPAPGFQLQRNRSTPFASKWLSWIGPWTLTTFMSRLDDERVVSDTLLFGIRVAFKPINSLEIGGSRTAQWCGDNRPCGFGTFTDLLIGNDNRRVNVDPNDEPGNQLAGIDIRWALPHGIPVALYMQWIGEDTRRGGPEIGSWLRQGGIEFRGRVFGLDHRTHLEISDTMCREGGFGFADFKPNCAYEHSIYQTGYRYEGRPIGHGMDGDGLGWSLGSTLVQDDGHTLSVSLRYVEINRSGEPDGRHSISATPQELSDLLVTYDRITALGRIRVGLGYSHVKSDASGDTSNDIDAFIDWSTR